MKISKKIQMIAGFMIFLMVSLPFVFASDLSLTYDANGNLVTEGDFYRVYNSLNQLVKVYNGSSAQYPLLQEFEYHPVEERILKKHDYSKNETTYYWSKEFVTIVNESGTYNFTYVYHNGQMVAQEVNSVKEYVHGDHLGSTSVVTNSAGSVIENTTYTPFGEISSGGTRTKFDYEGKEYDSNTEDYDFHFRKYMPGWGIFTQPDSLIPNVYDPQSLNRYMFERGNPYKNTDETGHFVCGGACVASLLLAVLAIYLVGQWGLAITNLKVEAAKESGNKEEIIEASIEHYGGAFVSALPAGSGSGPLQDISTQAFFNDVIEMMSDWFSTPDYTNTPYYYEPNYNIPYYEFTNNANIAGNTDDSSGGTSGGGRSYRPHYYSANYDLSDDQGVCIAPELIPEDEPDYGYYSG